MLQAGLLSLHGLEGCHVPLSLIKPARLSVLRGAMVFYASGQKQEEKLGTNAFSSKPSAAEQNQANPRVQNQIPEKPGQLLSKHRPSAKRALKALESSKSATTQYLRAKF